MEWTRELLKVIESEKDEFTPYGKEHVTYRKTLERVAGKYLAVRVTRNGIITHTSQDGDQERIQEYCADYGVKW